MKHDMKKIREAMYRMHDHAVNNGPPYMRIPADPSNDADLILLAAIDEPEALRAKEAELNDAVVKWLSEANALSMETGGPLTEIRRAFGPGVNSAWSMGSFAGPCAHGRDPYTRCDTCGEMEPREAFVAALKATL